MAGRVEGLRAKHQDSITLNYELPIVFANNPKGAKHIFIDPARLPYFLAIHQRDMIALREAGLIQAEVPVRIPKIRIEYAALAQEYLQKLNGGEFPTRADLARSIGVSRAWISKVMKRGSSGSAVSA